MSEVIGFFKNKKNVVNRVVETYLEHNECLCDWPEFEYWTGKGLFPGLNSTYTIQYELIKVFCNLPIYSYSKPIVVGDSYQVNCLKCSRKWSVEEYEFRMMGYIEQLRPIVRTPDIRLKFKDIDFSTCGYHKDKGHLLSLEHWAEFMLGSLYEA